MMKNFLKLTALALPLSLISAAALAEITAEGYFARATAGTAKNGAVFVTLKNQGEADALLAASSDASAKVELHTHIQDGDVMRMREVSSIALPKDGGATLKPGGDHIMLMGLKSPLVEGSKVKLTLTFKNAKPLELEVPVAGVGAMQGPNDGHHHGHNHDHHHDHHHGHHHGDDADYAEHHRMMHGDGSLPVGQYHPDYKHDPAHHQGAGK